MIALPSDIKRKLSELASAMSWPDYNAPEALGTPTTLEYTLR